MYAGIFTAIEASAVSVFATLLMLVAYRRLSAASVLEAVKRTIRVSGMIYMIIVSGRRSSAMCSSSRVSARWWLTC